MVKASVVAVAVILVIAAAAAILYVASTSRPPSMANLMARWASAKYTADYSIGASGSLFIFTFNVTKFLNGTIGLLTWTQNGFSQVALLTSPIGGVRLGLSAGRISGSMYRVCAGLVGQLTIVTCSDVNVGEIPLLNLSQVSRWNYGGVERVGGLLSYCYWTSGSSGGASYNETVCIAGNGVLTYLDIVKVAPAYSYHVYLRLVNVTYGEFLSSYFNQIQASSTS